MVHLPFELAAGTKAYMLVDFVTLEWHDDRQSVKSLFCAEENLFLNSNAENGQESMVCGDFIFKFDMKKDKSTWTFQKDCQL